MGLAIVLGVRLTVPLAIFRWPLAGGLMAIVADAVDIIIFDVAGFPNFANYQEIDKLLDSYYLAIEVIVAQQWLAAPRITASALFVYRMIGVALFELTDARALLLVFPNVFELFFLFYAWLLRYRPSYLLTPRETAGWLAVLLVSKLVQEYLLHYLRVLDDYVATDVIRDAWHAFVGWLRRLV